MHLRSVATVSSLHVLSQSCVCFCILGKTFSISDIHTTYKMGCTLYPHPPTPYPYGYGYGITRTDLRYSSLPAMLHLPMGTHTRNKNAR
jgi:hypothetical protein